MPNPISINNVALDTNELFTAITQEVNIVIPDIDLNSPEYNIPFDPNDPVAIPKPLTNEDLATGQVDGDGTFEVLMQSAIAYLREEYNSNRIVGSDYARAMMGIMESAMSNATQFLLNRDRATWESRIAQVNTYTARAELAVSKMKVATTMYDTYGAKARYAEGKMNASNAAVNYAQGKYRYEEMMPVEFAVLGLQKKGQEFTNEGLNLQNETVDYNLNQTLPQQLELLVEQTETARGQTADMRSDGAVITGLIGKQKDLTTQQITSYRHQSQINVSKMYVDYAITSKSLDPGLVGPDNFTNASTDSVLNKLKTEVELR